MSSLEIAQLTGMLHKNVMQAIRNMEPAWEKINGLKFKLVEYTDKKGEKRPCYSLDKTETLYIATKFNDEARAKLVLRWKELETANKPKMPTNYIESLEALLKSEKEKARLSLENQQQQALIEQKSQQLDESMEWYSIKRWAQLHHKNWRSYSWRKLKALSFELGYTVKKIFDANYGEVNIYNKNVFDTYEAS